MKEDGYFTCIYTISDPDTLEVRYVGRASLLKERIKTHKHSKTPIGLWIASLLIIGKDPVFTEVDNIDNIASQMTESDWVAKIYKAGNKRLFNKHIWTNGIKYIKNQKNDTINRKKSRPFKKNRAGKVGV